MIRAAAIAGLAIWAGTAEAEQTLAPGDMTAAVEACGGTVITLVAFVGDEEVFEGGFDAAMARSEEVLNARLGGGVLFDFVAPLDDMRLQVSLPGSTVDLDQFLPVLARGDLGFHDVAEGGIAMPLSEMPSQTLTLDPAPLLTGADIADAEPVFDMNGAPSVSFRFTPEGGRTFGAITGDRIGQQIAIVLDGVIMTAPIIQSRIDGGTGLITGSFTVEEAQALAAILRSGQLPVDFEIEEVFVKDAQPGGDPALCPSLDADN